MFEHESLNNLVSEQVQTHENLDFKRILVAVTFKKYICTKVLYISALKKLKKDGMLSKHVWLI